MTAAAAETAVAERVRHSAALDQVCDLVSCAYPSRVRVVVAFSSPVKLISSSCTDWLSIMRPQGPLQSWWFKSSVLPSYDMLSGPKP